MTDAERTNLTALIAAALALLTAVEDALANASAEEPEEELIDLPGANTPEGRQAWAHALRNVIRKISPLADAAIERGDVKQAVEILKGEDALAVQDSADADRFANFTRAELAARGWGVYKGMFDEVLEADPYLHHWATERSYVLSPSGEAIEVTGALDASIIAKMGRTDADS